MTKLLFRGAPKLVDDDGVVVHHFTRDAGIFEISRWLYLHGYNYDNFEIPDVNYHEVFLILNNLHFYKPNANV